MSCPDLDDEIKDLEAELEQITRLKRAFEAEQELVRPRKEKVEKPKVLKLFTGEEVTVDPGEFKARLEEDAIGMGEETVREMVRAGFEGNKGPSGRTGRMVNYGQLDPSDENVARLLEVMGLRRADTPKGVELRETFTSQIAARELMLLAQKAGADPRKFAERIGSRARNLNQLPSTVFTLAKMRWDSASQYADALDELADAIDGAYINDSLKTQAGNIAKWAYYYEQLDARARRYVGQALKSLQFNPDADLPVFDFTKDVADLTIDDIKGNSLVADMLKLTAEGNAKALRKRAAAKRMAKMTEGGINESGFMSQLRILNDFRRANLLSSPNTWLLRNPISGALVQGLYMGEDVLSGTMRLVSTNGLKDGVADGLKAASYAFSAFNSAWRMSWGNAQEMLMTGRGAMTGDSPKYVQVQFLKEPKDFVNEAWSVFENSSAIEKVNPIMLFNAANALVFKKLGQLTEATLGSDVGYGGPFRLLNAGDEFVRTQSYVWKTNHEAFIRAVQEGKEAGQKVEWIQKRADELAEKTIFSGVFSDDDLAEFRKTRNAQYDIPVSDEIDDDELRMLLYDNYKNAPNMANEIGAAGSKRMTDVTFTGELTNNVSGGFNQMRSNPVIGWLVPFYRVPLNGLGWVLNREILIALPKQLLMESKQGVSQVARSQAFSKLTDTSDEALAALPQLRFTPEEMADARARTTVAAAIAAATTALWQQGVFTDGGGFDPRQRERSRALRSPYSFVLGGIPTPAGRFNISGGAPGVDFIDLMGLHADIMRAAHEGFIGQQDAASAAGMIVKAHAMMLSNRLSLRGVTTFLNFLQDPERYDVSRMLSDQMGGVLPLSGVLGQASRTFADPNLGYAKRRVLSADEQAVISKDPIFKVIEPVLNLLRPIAQGNGNYPVVGLAVAREKDWLGDTIVRPLGIPYDMTIPFMPVVRIDDPLRRWLEKHGFGDKPNPDATVKVGGVQLQMTNPEEDSFRIAMRETKAEYTPEQVGTSAGRLMPIWQYLRGNTMREALQALSEDPRYNEMLNSTVGGVSPSLVAQPGKALSKRVDAGGAELYAPIDDIINYYEQLGMMEVMNKHPEFKGRFDAIVRKKQEGLQGYAESVGLQRVF
jgi:hypothetical protein